MHEKVSTFGKILVLSRSSAQSFTTDKPWAAISISTTGNYAKLNKCQQIGLLQLAFADANELTPEMLAEVPELEGRLFSEEQASRILDFVAKHWDNVETLLVHCYGGVSRSPAVAAAISKIYYGNDRIFFDIFSPNHLVYRTILTVAAKRGLIDEVPPVPGGEFTGCVYCGD